MQSLQAQIPELDIRHPPQSSILPNSFSRQFDQIQQYLSLDCLQQYCKSVDLDKQYFKLSDSENASLTSLPTTSFLEPEKPRKSQFHNFQKHLINLVRKVIRITKNKCEGQNKKIALKLWNAFVYEHCYSKKILNLLFGFMGNDNSEIHLERILLKFPTFQKIHQRYSIEQISEAQQWLRNEVVKQARHLKKNSIHSKSLINKFESFYLYFIAFIDELQAGSFGRRMAKKTKTKIINIIAVHNGLNNGQ